MRPGSTRPDWIDPMTEIMWTCGGCGVQPLDCLCAELVTDCPPAYSENQGELLIGYVK